MDGWPVGLFGSISLIYMVGMSRMDFCTTTKKRMSIENDEMFLSCFLNRYHQLEVYMSKMSF